MKYWAILKDSFKETVDFKTFYILLCISVFLIIAVASFTFPRHPLDEALSKNLRVLAATDVAEASGSMFSNTGDYHFHLSPAQPPLAAKEIHSRTQSLLNQHEQRLRFFRMAMMIEEANQEEMRAMRRGGALEILIPRIPKSGEFQEPKNRADRGALVERFLNAVPGIAAAHATPTGPDIGPPTGFDVEAQINWAELRYAHQIGFLFGVWKMDLDADELDPMGGTTMGQIVSQFIQTPLVEWVAGWAGIIIALIVTAGFIPNMLRKGTIDFLLVKPLSRSALLIYKYLGGLAFVFLNAIVLVGGTWIAFGFTTGNWSPWYLSLIFTLTFFFAILYAFSVLMGVLTRSTLASILITIGFWFLLFIVNRVYVTIHLPALERRATESVPALISVVDAAHLILPKPSDLGILNQSLILKVNGTEEMLKLQQEAMGRFSWSNAIWTSSVFVVLVLAFACWRFQRKDY